MGILKIKGVHRAVLGLALVTLVLSGEVRGEASPVVAVEVEKETVSAPFEVSGTVTSARRSNLSARTEGLVARMLVDSGSVVEAGDVLMELDSALAELALSRAEQALVEAETRLKESLRLVEEGKTLVKTGGIPSTEAEARFAAARALQAQLNQLQVEVRERREVLARHQLIAPFAGVISLKESEVGEWVSTGDPVLELVDVEAVRFDAQVPQERYSEFGGQLEISVELDSLPGVELPAKLLAKVPVKDPVARTFLARFSVDAPDGVLAPGVSGRARIQQVGKMEQLIIPRDAVLREPNGDTSVWVVVGSGEVLSAERRMVRLSEGMGQRVAVLDGLSEGERVVIRGNEALREGQTIKLPEAS